MKEEEAWKIHIDECDEEFDSCGVLKESAQEGNSLDATSLMDRRHGFIEGRTSALRETEDIVMSHVNHRFDSANHDKVSCEQQIKNDFKRLRRGKE